jgi:hypothetical protein
MPGLLLPPSWSTFRFLFILIAGVVVLAFILMVMIL